MRMNNHSNPGAKAGMAGVGMLEVLIALLVLSIGVLGMSQLQGVATRQNYNGYLRSQATFLAASIADRMRSNQKHAEDYVIDMADDPPSGSSLDMAQNDVKEWLDKTAAMLPSGDGEIKKSSNTQAIGIGTSITFDTYTITVKYEIPAQYDDEDTDGNGLKAIEVSVETVVTS